MCRLDNIRCVGHYPGKTTTHQEGALSLVKQFAGLDRLNLYGFGMTAFAHGSAQEVADKWATNLGNAQQSMTAGVQRVTESPGQAAVAKQQKWVRAMQSAEVQAKWARKTGAVSLQSWKDSMTNIGIQRAAQGATQKKQKMVNAMTTLLPFIDQVAASVRAMPDNTPADREQRALAMMRGMRQYQGNA